MSAIKDEWIFYLKLGPKLNENFFSLDRHFKQYGFNLIPVSFPNLLELIKNDETFHVIVVVGSKREAAYYLKNLSKPLRNLLRFNKINLFSASSFGFVNESANLTFRGNYDFYPLPIKAAQLCDKILFKVLDQAADSKQWPGGKSPRVSISK